VQTERLRVKRRQQQRCCGDGKQTGVFRETMYAGPMALLSKSTESSSRVDERHPSEFATWNSSIHIDEPACLASAAAVVVSDDGAVERCNERRTGSLRVNSRMMVYEALAVRVR